MFVATALQLRGFSVVVVEQRVVAGRVQEWNSSWGEMQVGGAQHEGAGMRAQWVLLPWRLVQHHVVAGRMHESNSAWEGEWWVAHSNERAICG